MLNNDVTDTIAQEEQSALQVCFGAESMRVQTQEDYASAGQFLLQVSKKLKDLEKMRKFFTKRLNDQVKAINDKFRPSKEKYTQAQGILKRAMADFMSIQEARKQEALEVAQQKSNANDVAGFYEMAQIAHESEVFQTAGVHTRESWKFEIQNIAQVPLDFLTVDEPKLRAFVKANKDTVQIPGVRIYKDVSVVART